jgi:hypothetical protein
MFDALVLWAALASSGYSVAYPPATPEIRSLVQSLGDEVYDCREESENKLKLLGNKAIAELKLAILTTKSPEIRFRAYQLVTDFYAVVNSKKNVPSIWSLPPSFEFKSNQFYFERPHYYVRATIVDSQYGFDWTVNRWAEYQAVRDLTTILLDAGYDREEIVKLLDVMTNSAQSYQGENAWYPYDPIEP